MATARLVTQGYRLLSRFRPSAGPQNTFRQFGASATRLEKAVAVLYEGGDAALNEPRLLGTVENKLGLEHFFKERGWEYVVTADKEGPNSEFERHLPDATIVITTPFHPGYLTKERLEKAKNLKLAVTAGVGSDHVDLLTAVAKGITVAEVTGCNVVSVAEHVVMMILSLVRNYIPGYTQVINGEWDVAKIASRAYDVEGKVIGTIGAGRIGQRVLERLRPFNPGELLYTDYGRMAPEREKELGCRYVDMDELVRTCDVVTINVPLHKDTEHLFDSAMLGKMKKGAWLVNTARGKICDRDAVVEALKSGQLAGYAGDVWYPQPAPPDHPWRHMPYHAMTPHYSGTTLDAQARYAAGTRDIIQRWMEGRELNAADVIVLNGKLAPQYDKAAQSGDRSLTFEKGWEKDTVSPRQ